MNPVIQNTAHSRFELEQEGLISVANYRLNGEVIVITYVGVPEPLRGQGLAGRLAAAVVDYARENGLKIRPVCSYMAAYMRRHPETLDLQV
jgi:hypothetical protein